MNKFFNNENLEMKYYILGLLFSDGYVSGNGRSIELSLTGKEEKHLIIKISEVFEKNGIKIRNLFYDHGRNRLFIHNRDFHSEIVSMGCINKKSLTVEYPNIPQEYNRSFLRGVFDGDGSVYIKNNGTLYPRISSASINFINSIVSLLNSNDIKTKVYKHKNDSVYDICILDVVSQHAFFNFIYTKDAMCLNRKRDIFIQFFANFKLKMLENKNSFYALDQDYIKEICKSFNLQYSEEYAYKYDKNFRDEIKLFFMKNNKNTNKTRKHFGISNTLVSRIVKEQ